MSCEMKSETLNVVFVFFKGSLSLDIVSVCAFYIK